MSGHVIVCGLKGLGFRIVEQLHQSGVEVVVVDDDADRRFLSAVEGWSLTTIRASPRDSATLRRAGIDRAAAVVCVDSGDLQTLETALLARDLRPDIRVVLQLANPAVGRAVGEVIGAGEVLDVAALAGPSMVEACVPDAAHHLDLGGVRFVAAPSTCATDGSLRQLFGDLAPIAVIHADGEPVACPGRDHAVVTGDQVTVLATPAELADAGIGSGEQPRRRVPHPSRHLMVVARRFLRSLAAETDRSLRIVVGLLLTLVVTATVVLRIGYRAAPPHSRLHVIDALYFTVETIATVGYGDFSFAGQALWLEAFGIGLIVIGAALVTTIFALITNFLVGRRLATALGYQRVGGMRDHVILVGLGSVGLRVLEGLLERGIAAVIIERDEANRHLVQARALRVPIMSADATLRQSLQAANIGSASAVVVLTSDDLTNIEVGLAARDQLGERWPAVPVVLRVFDRSLARIVERSFGFSFVRSTSALATPWFVGAALGLDVLATFYVGQQPFMVGSLRVTAGGGLAGVAMQDLSARTRVIALDRAANPGHLEHPPRRNTRFESGDRAYLVGPYEELLRVLQRDAAANAPTGG